jgi:hypothetical protein
MQGVLGGHAITICGYDDKAQEYMFINSWGEDWGDKGFGYITYAHMKSILMDAYALIDISDPLPYKVLANKLTLTGKDYFPLPLDVRFIDGHIWELREDFEFRRDFGEIIHIPKGFKFDFASIPQLFWGWIGSPTGEYGPAALVHDFLCEKHNFPKEEADKIFLEAMEALGVACWKRWTMYLAVRAFHCFR